jgi:hypothetical protein
VGVADDAVIFKLQAHDRSLVHGLREVISVSFRKMELQAIADRASHWELTTDTDNFSDQRRVDAQRFHEPTTINLTGPDV